MAHYIVGIDETGSFDKKGKTSRVGGVVFRNPRGQMVRDLLDKVRQDWNAAHPDSQVRSIQQFHYFPLRGIDFGKSNESALSPQEGEEFTDAVVQRLRDSPEFEMAFLSSGFPSFFTDEQQAYVDILRTTLWGLLAHKLQLGQGDSADIYIAPRSQAQGYYSVWKPKDRDAYYRFLVEQLHAEFGDFERQRGIQLRMESAGRRVTQCAEVIAADFFLGNHKTKGVKLIYTLLPFQQFYHLTAGIDPVEEIEQAYQSGDCPAIPAIFRLLHIHAIESLKEKGDPKAILGKIKKIMKETAEREHLIEEFVSLLDKTLESWIAERAEDSQNMRIAENYCDCIEKLYPAESVPENPWILRMQETALRHRIGIESHKGSVEARAGHLIEKYRRLFDAHRQTIYPTIGKRLERLLEMELKAVQISHFNNYQFAEVEQVFDPHYKRYRELYGSMLKAGEKDALYGKICGTLGQAYAFLYAMNREDWYCEMAADLLEEDTRHFAAGTRDWGMGMHYRIHLELIRPDRSPEEAGHLDQAAELMKELWGIRNLSPASLLPRMIESGSIWDLSLALKFLGYCQRRAPFPELPEGFPSLLAHISGKGLPWYPTCNMVKWAAGLALLSGHRETAADFLAELGPLQEDDFTLKTLEIPILQLRAFLQSKSPKPAWERIEALAGLQPGFAECVRLGRWREKFPSDTAKRWDVRDILEALPFYYA